MSTLPGVLGLTDRGQLPPGRTLAGQLEPAVSAGLRVVVLRERDLPPADRQRLAAELRRLLSPVGGLLVAADPYVVGADGVHLRRDAPDARPTGTPTPALTGRSCHDAGELRAAAIEGVDYVTLSPVAPSGSKPGYGPALGAHGLREALERAPGAPPAYALGGVTPQNASELRAAGAYGVAVMGGLMRARDPGALVRDLDPALEA